MFVETIKIENGKVCNLPFHIRRMGLTGEFYSFLPPQLPLLESLLPSNLSSEKVKCRVVYSSSVEKIEFILYKEPRIKSLRLVNAISSLDYSFKKEDRRELQELFSQREDCDDVLIIKDGFATDTSFCNVLFEKDNRLYTPKACLLNGTKREKLIEDGLIEEKDIYIGDLKMYDRAILINAMLDIEDNISIDIANIR